MKFSSEYTNTLKLIREQSRRFLSLPGNIIESVHDSSSSNSSSSNSVSMEKNVNKCYRNAAYYPKI